MNFVFISCPNMDDGCIAAAIGSMGSVKPCNQNIFDTFRPVQEMIELADRGDMDREDTGCGILCGIMRDSACRLEQIAGKERRARLQKGW
jgi:hypothetical protein